MAASRSKVRSDVLVFEVAGRRYGLPLEAVRELLRAVAPTPLPKAPPVVQGVVNLRGALVPVLDLRGRFGLPRRPVEPGDHFVVAWRGARPVALAVDRAVELVALGESELEDACEVVPGAEYIARVAKLPDGLVLIQDLAAFLTAAEEGDLEDALRRAAEPKAPPAEAS